MLGSVVIAQLVGGLPGTYRALGSVKLGTAVILALGSEGRRITEQGLGISASAQA